MRQPIKDLEPLLFNCKMKFSLLKKRISAHSENSIDWKLVFDQSRNIAITSMDSFKDPSLYEDLITTACRQGNERNVD